MSKDGVYRIAILEDGLSDVELWAKAFRDWLADQRLVWYWIAELRSNDLSELKLFQRFADGTWMLRRNLDQELEALSMFVPSDQVSNRFITPDEFLRTNSELPAIADPNELKDAIVNAIVGLRPDILIVDQNLFRLNGLSHPRRTSYRGRSTPWRSTDIGYAAREKGWHGQWLAFTTRGEGQGGDDRAELEGDPNRPTLVDTEWRYIGKIMDPDKLRAKVNTAMGRAIGDIVMPETKESIARAERALDLFARCERAETDFNLCRMFGPRPTFKNIGSDDGIVFWAVVLFAYHFLYSHPERMLKTRPNGWPTSDTVGHFLGLHRVERPTRKSSDETSVEPINTGRERECIEDSDLTDPDWKQAGISLRQRMTKTRLKATRVTERHVMERQFPRPVLECFGALKEVYPLQPLE